MREGGKSALGSQARQPRASAVLSSLLAKSLGSLCLTNPIARDLARKA